MALTRAIRESKPMSYQPGHLTWYMTSHCSRRQLLVSEFEGASAAHARDAIPRQPPCVDASTNLFSRRRCRTVQSAEALHKGSGELPVAVRGKSVHRRGSRQTQLLLQGHQEQGVRVARVARCSDCMHHLPLGAYPTSACQNNGASAMHAKCIHIAVSQLQCSAEVAPSVACGYEKFSIRVRRGS